MICILQYHFHYGTESVILKVLFSFVIAQSGLLTWISTVETTLLVKNFVGNNYSSPRKNSSLSTDEIFCWAIYETYYKTLIFPVFL